jgi:steroid 5-alpha reductase family enzyme
MTLFRVFLTALPAYIVLRKKHSAEFGSPTDVLGLTMWLLGFGLEVRVGLVLDLK